MREADMARTNRISRRRFHQLAGAAVATSAFGLSACATMDQPKARVVVIGGGFGGATAAKNVRMLDPGIEVTLVEPAQTKHTGEIISDMTKSIEQQAAPLG